LIPLLCTDWENSFCWTKNPQNKITGKKCDRVSAQRRMSGWAEFDELSLRKWRWWQNRNQKCESRRRTKTTKTELTELRSYGGGFLCLCSHWISLFSIHTVLLPTWKNWPHNLFYFFNFFYNFII
jgi:hypothetical protein